MYSVCTTKRIGTLSKLLTILWQAARHRLPNYYIIALYNCVMLSSPKLFHLSFATVHHIDSFRWMVLCVRALWACACACAYAYVLCLMPKYLSWIADVEAYYIRRTYTHTKHSFQNGGNSSSISISNSISISCFNGCLIIVLRECKVKVRACVHAIRCVHM